MVTYMDLDVWKKANLLYGEVSRLVILLPYNLRGLADQMVRSAASIPSNIAEGNGRSSTKEYLKFLSYSQGSLNELRTQLNLYEISMPEQKEKIMKARVLCGDISRMLNRLTEKLESKIKK